MRPLPATASTYSLEKADSLPLTSTAVTAEYQKTFVCRPVKDVLWVRPTSFTNWYWCEAVP